MTVFPEFYSKELKNPTFNNSDFVSGVLLFEVDQASNGWRTASVNIDQDMPFQPMFEVRFSMVLDVTSRPVPFIARQ